MPRSEGIACSRREAIKGFALLGVAEKLTDGGYAEVSAVGEPERGLSVLPPGAGSRHAFAAKCVACQLCVVNCPEQVLRPSRSWRNFGQPELSFREGFCRLACTRCTSVCPSGALVKLVPRERVHVHLGTAHWRKELCVRQTNGDKCTACVRKCPVRAIDLVQGFPVVDEVKCVGCGACEHVCPARPEPAIFVKGVEMQRRVRPLGDAELIAEMCALVKGGKAAVVARDGVIVKTLEGRGIRPIVAALDEDREVFAGATVVDKIVGRAAAAVYLAGCAKKVYAEVMSESAKAMLTAAGIEVGAAEFVERIVNREGTGACPMDTAVGGLDEPQAMLEAIRKAMEK